MSRLFCFTNFDLDFDYENFYDQNSIRYLIVGRETCPDTGRQHDQGFVYFNNQRRLKKSSGGKYFSTTVAKGLNNCHVEACLGDFDSNVKYCSKDNDIREWGDRPQQGFRTDLAEVFSNLTNGKETTESILLTNPSIYHLYGRTLEKIEDVLSRKKIRTKMTRGIWLYGDTGVGKSHRAFSECPQDDTYVYPEDGGWWDGYRGEKYVIFNEFRGNTLKFSELLDLLDRYPKTVRRRGREPTPFLAEKIYLCSSLHPRDAFVDVSTESLDQLYRRIDIIEMTQKSLGNTETKDL